MTTNAEKKESGKYTIDDWVKIVIAASIGIGGGQAINVSSQPSERVAVLETKVQTIEVMLPKMDDKLDTLLMRVARVQK